MKARLAGETAVLERSLATGNLILSKAGEEQLLALSMSEYTLDPQIAGSYRELGEQLSGLQTAWGALSGDIQQNEQRLAEKEQLAREGYEEMEELLEIVQALRSELDQKGPPGAVPSIAEQQLAGMQQLLSRVTGIDTAVAALKERLQVLNPHAVFSRRIGNIIYALIFCYANSRRF